MKGDKIAFFSIIFGSVTLYFNFALCHNIPLEFNLGNKDYFSGESGAN